MATRRGTVVLEDDEATAQTRQEEELEQANEDTDGELLRSLQEMAGTAGVTFLFTRTYPNTPDSLGFVGEMTPAEFTLDRVREVYGPGHYRVRVKGPKGFLPGGGTIKVAKGPGGPGSGAAPSSGFADVAALMRAMQEKDDARRKEESERRGRLMEIVIPASITGLTTMVAALMGRNTGPDITQLITALKPAPPAPGPSLTDLTTALTNMRSLTNEKSGGESQFETIFKILELAKEHAGGGEKGESNWIDLARDVIKEGLPAVRPILENLQAQQQARQIQNVVPQMAVVPASARPVAGVVQTTVSPVPITTKSGSTVSTENSGEDMNILAAGIIRDQLNKIVSWAQANRDPVLYAEVLLAELPEIVHKFVTPVQALEGLRNSEWFKFVTTQEPRLTPFGQWCDIMRRELIEIIEEQIKNDVKEPPSVDSSHEEIGE